MALRRGMHVQNKDVSHSGERPQVFWVLVRLRVMVRAEEQ